MDLFFNCNTKYIDTHIQHSSYWIINSTLKHFYYHVFLFFFSCFFFFFLFFFFFFFFFLFCFVLFFVVVVVFFFVFVFFLVFFFFFFVFFFFFLFVFLFLHISFGISCRLSSVKIMCTKCQSLFSGKINIYDYILYICLFLRKTGFDFRAHYHLFIDRRGNRAGLLI